MVLAPTEKRTLPNTDASRQKWESLAEELRTTDDTKRIKELVMLLEEAIFNRQQELALNADSIEKPKIEQEEQGLRQALDLMLEIKAKRLGFPDIR
jgi:hypothetical protein